MKPDTHWLAVIDQGVRDPDSMVDVIHMIKADALRWAADLADGPESYRTPIRLARMYRERADAIERDDKQERTNG